jgi:LCP family protein required for cell wall assembly
MCCAGTTQIENERRDMMADRIKEDYVDISSSSEVNKVYGKEPSAHAQPQTKKKKKGFAFRIITLVLSIIMLLGGSGIVYYYSVLDKMNFKEVNIPQPATTNTGETTTVSVVSNGTSLLSSDDVLNILLFGQDAHGNGKNDYGRSDTTILMSIDNIHKKIKLTSFQRDTYVTIPGIGDDKINAAFSLGGEGLSINTIEANFGIKVDKYATVDFSSFRKIITAIGGIDIELNLEEIEYINAQIDVNNQIGKTSFLQYDPSKETQVMHLDGYQALWYARDRGEESLGGNPAYSFSGDDWDRTARQRKLIQTIINYMKTQATITDLVNIVNEIGPMITTNLKKEDITFLVSNAMTYLKYDIDQISLPTEGSWRYGVTNDGQSVIVIDDWDKARYDLASFVYESGVVSGNN